MFAHLGPLSLRWYGVIMAIAVLVGALVFAGQLRRGHRPRPRIGMLIIAVPSRIIGARLFHVVDDFASTGTTGDMVECNSWGSPSTG